MSSFPAQARRVRDIELPLRRRLLALRECVLHFAPYGFRATWDHLVVNAGLPQQLELDPDSLLRAIDELEEARHLWLAHSQEFTSRRRLEKAGGQRQPRQSERWLSWHGQLAFCPDPQVHPDERLATVVQRLITTYGSEATRPSECAACGRSRPSPPCPHCGADTRSPSDVRASTRPDTTYRWQQIWRRAAYRQDTRQRSPASGNTHSPISDDRLDEEQDQAGEGGQLDTR